MKNTKLRKQCADVIRYLRKHSKRGLSRPETEVDISSLNIDYHNLRNFVLEAQHRNISLDKVYFRYSGNSEFYDVDDPPEPFEQEGVAVTYKLMLTADGYEIDDEFIWMPLEEYWGAFDRHYEGKEE